MNAERTHNTAANTALLTAMHLTVDALCACCLMLLYPSIGTAGVVTMFVAYNVLAFMTQPLVGLWMDRQTMRRQLLYIAVAMLAAGALATILVAPPTTDIVARLPLVVGPIVLAIGLGNAIFHVFGGKCVTESTANDLRHLGIFVSSGAVGLAVGGQLASIATLAVVTALLTTLAAVFGHLWPAPPAAAESRRTAATESPDITAPPTTAESRPTIAAPAATIAAPAATESREPRQLTGTTKWLIVSVLLIVIARSFLGKVVDGHAQNIPHAAIILALVTFAGKVAGGFVALRFGPRRTLIAALLTAGACYVLGATCDAAIVAMVLAVNLTMAVTLWTANRLLPTRAGLAFGLLAGVLLPGYALGAWCAASPMALRLTHPLVATIVIETLVLLCLREHRPKVLTMSAVMNVLTNVPLNLLALRLAVLQQWPGQIAAEVTVAAVEALLFRLVTPRWRTAIVYAIACNGISYLIGIAFNALIYNI